MIVSVNRSESQIWPVYDVDVFLDGEKLPFCFYADDEVGVVRCYVIAEGVPVFTPDGKDFKTETKYGEVLILHGDSK